MRTGVDVEIHSKYKWDGARHEWVGIIYMWVGTTETVLTVGCERTEFEIERWLRAALENRPWEDGGIPTPDMYDRAKERSN